MKKMAAKHGGLYYMFLAPTSEVSGSATGPNAINKYLNALVVMAKRAMGSTIFFPQIGNTFSFQEQWTEGK